MRYCGTESLDDRLVKICVGYGNAANSSDGRPTIFIILEIGLELGFIQAQTVMFVHNLDTVGKAAVWCSYALYRALQYLIYHRFIRDCGSLLPVR